ncbi:MAG: PD-(D/E)XK nuclease family transposase [Taibaiella sp.]|nr:PD-(D/E)XK nuclease family transposase [Taibaiella sp.]
MAVYINPFTDYGFKKIFGEEASKPILIDFLNALLKNESPIKDLSFKNNEQLGQLTDAKNVIFDIYCENENGEKIIVELQKSKQNWFKERTIYYSTFPIREQVTKGDISYNFKAVYCIGILDFTFNDYNTEQEAHEWLHEIKLKDQNGQTFYDKLTYLYMEMPNFNKAEDELVTRLEKWLYFIKHLEDFHNIPKIFNDEVVFIEAFQKAEIAKFNKSQLDSYEYSLKGYRDLKGAIDTAVEKARLENTIKIATNMKAMGIPDDIINKTTGLSVHEIANL